MIELTDEILTKVIKKRVQNSHKGDYGRLLLIGGNAQYGGAAILAASAAVYAGTGLTTVACDVKNHTALHARLPEAMVVDFTADLSSFIKTADVIVIGCGLGLETRSLALLKTVLALQRENQRLVIDGSAIHLFAENDLELRFPEQTVFTPHQMELQVLSNVSIEKQTLENVQAFTDQMGSIIVAKSPETKIFSPRQIPFVLKIGTPAQATGGMGDSLAGIIGAFLCQFRINLVESVAAAVYLHSVVAQSMAETQYVVLPSQIIAELPKMMKTHESSIYS